MKMADNSAGTVTTTTNDNGQADSVPDNVKVLGISGGIGCGKSLACRILASTTTKDDNTKAFHGCDVHHIDTDSLAHSVYAPGSLAIQQIIEEFGDKIVADEKNENDNSKTLDRKKLGAIVFKDPEAMSKLEHIVWPHVKTKLLESIQRIASCAEDKEASTTENTNTKVVIVEAAVLLDAGWSHLLSALWVVTADEETASARLWENRQITNEDASTRIRAQTSRRGIGNLEEETQRGEVNAVIVNDGSERELEDKLRAAWLDESCWRDGIVPLGTIV